MLTPVDHLMGVIILYSSGLTVSQGLMLVSCLSSTLDFPAFFSCVVGLGKHLGVMSFIEGCWYTHWIPSCTKEIDAPLQCCPSIIITLHFIKFNLTILTQWVFNFFLLRFHIGSVQLSKADSFG